jgi:hypothetical protein
LPCTTGSAHSTTSNGGFRNTCRRAAVHVGTIDALLIQLCIRHELTLLSTDRDFEHAARWVSFRRWRPQPPI